MTKKKESDNRSLELIRELMQIHFMFGHDAELFRRKFLKKIQINSLKERGIIEVGCHLLDDMFQKKITEKNLNPGEIELYCLKKQGFLPEEIAVMLGFKSKQSVHVKQSRIKKKLKGTATPEVILILLLFYIGVYLTCMILLE